jgi:fructosamine-3-kinase
VTTAVPHLPGGLPAVAEAHALSGGDIGQVWRARLADGRTVVVKATSYDARLEADGLRALAAAGGPVPAVLAVDLGVLVLEHVSGRPDWHALGAAVATVHRDVGDAFGWHQDNVIGPLPQRNPPSEDWPAFYVEHRIRPYLDDLPADLRRRLAAACDRILPDLLDHDVPPSLVHGDLWSGNIVDGRWLVDPAVCRADRELDLAMLDLFGTIPPTFARGYAEVWPLDDGWEARRPALQLYHLLVHVRLFGSGYLGSVAARLDQLDR